MTDETNSSTSEPGSAFEGEIDPVAQRTPAAPQWGQAGWFDDGHGALRWWDGQKWTENTHTPESAAAAAAAAAAGPSAQPAPATVTAKASRPRRAVPLWLFITTAVVALVLGSAIAGGAAGASGGAAQGQIASLKSDLEDERGTVKQLQAQVDAADAKADELAKQQADLDAREAAIKAQETAIVAGTIPGSGTYLVGTDIQPGTYRSTDNTSCYWERDKTGDGSLYDIIDNDNVTGQAIVNIAATDKVFKTSRCSDWHKVG